MSKKQCTHPINPTDATLTASTTTSMYAASPNSSKRSKMIIPNVFCMLLIALLNVNTVTSFVGVPTRCHAKPPHGSSSSVTSTLLRGDAVETASPKAPSSTSSTATSWDIGVCNLPGVDYMRPQKVNQDSWFMNMDLAKINEDDLVTETTIAHTFHVEKRRKKKKKIPAVDKVVVGVLDGHGLKGHVCSQYFAKNLPFEIEKFRTMVPPSQPVAEYEDKINAMVGHNHPNNQELEEVAQNPHEGIHEALVHAFHAVHWNAMNDPEVPSARSGSTCIVCYMEKVVPETEEVEEYYNCHVAFVGDSRAICISENEMYPITIETTTDLEEEYQRIEAGDGQIEGPHIFYGPVGIAMTRALGDSVMFRAGVIPTPLVHTFSVRKGDTLVLASDGVWDVLTNEVVTDILENNEDGEAQTGAQKIVEAAKIQWESHFPFEDEMKRDDITAVVLRCN